MHRSLERGLTPDTVFRSVLEVGGNVGEHLRYVQHQFDRYLLTDIQHTMPASMEHQLQQRGIEFRIADVQKLPYADESFDRVLAMCLLHHIPDPEQALCEMRRTVRSGGQLDIFLPSDPGLLFRAARTLGPVRAAKARGLGEVKRLVDARDHRNHVGSLQRLSKHIFRKDHVSRATFPLPIGSWNLSLWQCFRVIKAPEESINVFG